MNLVTNRVTSNFEDDLFFGSSYVKAASMVRRGLGRWGWSAILLIGALAPTIASAQKRLEIPLATKPGPNEGKRPTGWIVRADTNTQAGRGADSIVLVNRGQGYYLASGPSGVVWSPKNVASGAFIVAGVLSSGPTGATIPDGFGVFLGGRNMQSPNAEYTEFLVRNDGRYAVFQHIGPRTVKLRDWTLIAGINTHSGRRDETVRNTFRVIVDPQNVQLVVNRTMATSLPRATFKPDGEYGVRIGTKQIIQIESLALQKAPK